MNSRMRNSRKKLRKKKVEQNFIQWLKEPNNDQVLTIMQQLYSHPYEWEINFESLSEATKAKLFFPLKEFFLDQLSDLPAERCYNSGLMDHGTLFILRMFMKTLQRT